MSDAHSNSDFMSSGSNANSPWPGGWYVFEDGRIQGPFSADTAFSMPEKSPAGSPKLVSRKGFSQWYPLRDLSELYRIADKLGQRTSTEVDRLESEVTENLANLEVLRALAQTGADPSVIAHPPRVVGKSINAGQVRVAPSAPVPAAFVAPLITPPVAEAPFAPEARSYEAPTESKSSPVPPAARRAMSRKERKALARRMAQHHAPQPDASQSKPQEGASRQVAQMPSPTGGVTINSPQKKQRVKHRGLTAKQALLQEYLLLRGRLRLGEIRSPLISAFFLAPLTLCLYWGVWYRDLARELVWHTRHSADQKEMPATWLAWIPIVHVIMAYKLAMLVREAERQNGYKAISPLLAGLFAVIPPLAMAYIQDGANQHWRLHVKHSIIERMNEASA